MIRKGYKEVFFIFLIGGIYLLLSVIYPSLPGLNLDEVIRRNPGFSIAHRTIEPPYPYHFSLNLSHRREFPLMLKHYIGPVYAYRTALFASIFGCSGIAVRLENVLITFIALIFTFFIIKELTNPGIAALASFLLSVDNSFVFFSRIGMVSFYFFKVFLIYLIFLYTKYQRPVFLYLAGLWAGIGVWARADFIIIPISIACVFLTIERKILSSEKLKIGFSFVRGFVLGAFPFLIYNLFNPLSTFRPMFRALIDLEAYNRAPMDEKPIPPFTENLIVKFKNFTNLLNGGAFNHFVFDEELKGLPYLWILYLIGTVLALYIGATTKDKKLKKAITISAIFGGMILLQLIFIPQARSYHHFLQIYPLPQLFMAIPLYMLFCENKPRFHWKKFLASLGFIILIFSHVFHDIKTLSLLKKTGGRGDWSDAIYELFDYLQKNKDKNFVIMDWGMSSQLYYMSCGKAKIKELFWSDNISIPLLTSYLMNPNNVFVFHTERYQRRKNLKNIFMETAKGNCHIVKPIFTREGEPIFEIFACERGDDSGLKSYIDFSEEDEKQLFGTWYHVEKNYNTYFRWTGKKFGVYLDNSKDNNRLLIRGFCTVDKIKDRFLQINLFINGKFVFSHRFERDQEFILDIPIPEDVKKEKILKVEVELDKTFYAPPDVRELGVMIYSIGLTQ
jgi:hypothetical protein